MPDNELLEQNLMYEKRIYDLEQLLDIAKSFCQNLDFGNLLESQYGTWNIFFEIMKNYVIINSGELKHE